MELPEIENELARAISEFKGRLPSEQLDNMCELATVGEPGIALEHLLTQISEYALSVNPKTLAGLRKLSIAMGIDEKYCKGVESRFRVV